MGDAGFKIETVEERGLTVLKMQGQRLEITQRESFGEACDRLLAAETEKIVIDLSDLDRIFSLFIGSLVDLHVRAERSGKRLSVIASEAVRESLGRMGLEKTLDIVAAEEQG